MAAEMESAPISDEWLADCDFKWRQSERQPNKHWSLKLNVEDEGNRAFNQVSIEVQRNGWENCKGDYIGDRERWMLWVTDAFDRTAFLGNILWQRQITGLAEIISGRQWNPSTHLYGQAWPEGSSVLKKRKDQ